jgi:hypothetical protein
VRDAANIHRFAKRERSDFANSEVRERKEKIKMPRIVEVVKEAIDGVSGRCIVASFQKLLDSRKTARFPNFEFTYSGPVDDLLDRMKKVSGPKGLPETGDQLVEWVKSPPNARLIRQAGVLIELPEKFCNRNCMFIRLERASQLPDHKTIPTPF